MIVAVVGFLVAWVLYGQVYRHGGDRPLEWQDLTALVGPLRFREPAFRVFESEAELYDYLSELGGLQLPTRIQARGRKLVLYAVGPRSRAGYRLRVVRAVEERGRLVLVLRERAPQLGDESEAGVTYPYVLVALPDRDKPVRVELEGR